MKRRNGLFVLPAILLCAGCGTGLRLGPMVKYNGPTGDFADGRDNGYTVGAAAEMQVTAISATGEYGYTTFRGGPDDDNFWELGLGGRLHFGPLFAGGKLTFLSGSADDDTSFRPEVGLQVGKLSAFAQYKFPGNRWWSLGASYSIF